MKKVVIFGYCVVGKIGISRKVVVGGYGEEYVNIFVGIVFVLDFWFVIIVLINEFGGDLYYVGDIVVFVFLLIMGGVLYMLNIFFDDK